MKVRVVIPKKKAIQVENAQCQECHQKIAPDAITCPNCHAPIVRKYCSRCSRLIPEETSACPFCGSSSNVKPKIEGRNLKTNLLVFGGLGLLIVLLISSNRDSSSLSGVDQPGNTRTVAHQTGVPERNDRRTQPDQMKTSTTSVTRSDEEGTRLNVQGHALIQEGKYEEAIQVLRLAIRSFPEDTTAVSYKFTLYNLGHSLRKVGRPEEAIPYLQKCFQLDTEWPKVVQELNLAQQAMDRKKMT